MKTKLEIVESILEYIENEQYEIRIESRKWMWDRRYQSLALRYMGSIDSLDELKDWIKEEFKEILEKGEKDEKYIKTNRLNN